MRNLEGYPDPTAGIAMRPRPPKMKSIEAPKIEKKKSEKPVEKKKIVYYAVPAYTAK